MIEIRDKSGAVKFRTEINKGAKGHFMLMKEDYITLPFVTDKPIGFKRGDYVDLRGVFDDALGGKLAKVYKYLTLQNPVAAPGKYSYTLRFDAYYHEWNTRIFKYTPEGHEHEAGWNLTAPLDVHLSLFLRNLKANEFKFNDNTEYTFQIDSSVENKAVLMSYDNTHLLDALYALAAQDKFNCDCWITDNVIHFGRCEFGDAVNIELGVEASAMSRNESKGTFATRLFVFGGTRNIPANYRPTDESVVVNGVVQRRLMLPEGTPYIDAMPNMSGAEIVEGIKVFDNIFPRRIGKLQEVKTVDRPLTGEGEPAGTFKAYQYKDSELLFKPEYILKDQQLEITFQSGRLNGKTFGVSFEPDGTGKGSQVWEIVANETYGRLLPDDTLYPANGDSYILTGFDIQLVSDQYIPAAEKELLEKGKEFIKRTSIDDGIYPTTLDSDWVFNDQINRTYSAGQRIRLKNAAFFPTEGRLSRVIGWDMNLDIPYDSPVYTVGESTQYSRISNIEEKLDTLTYQGQSFQGGNGSGIYIIRTNDKTAASDSNVFSALRTLRELHALRVEIDNAYLRKDIDDTAHGNILFDQKVGSTLFIEGMDGKGWEILSNGAAMLEALKVRSDIFAGNKIGSVSFAPGFTGWGVDIDVPSATGTFDNVFVRKTFTAYEIVYSQIYGLGGSQIVSDINKIGRVERLPDHWRCYMDDMDGLMLMNLREGDGVRIQSRSGINSIKYLFGRCIGTSSTYFDIAYPLIEGNGEPAEGDFAMRWGSESDTNRQGLIYLTSADQGAPFIAVYDGITGVSTQDKLKAQLGNLSMIRTKNGTQLSGYGAYLNGIYIENSTIYLDDGKTIEQTFSAMNGELRSEIESVKNDMSLESGNILVNSSFGRNMDSWASYRDISLMDVNDRLLWIGGAFYSDKRRTADIYTDGSRNVLRLRNAWVMQRNATMNIPEFLAPEPPKPAPEEGEQQPEDNRRMFSFSLFVRALTAGTLKVGFANQDLYEEQALEPSAKYVKISKAAKWNLSGDFRIEYSGEALIYGVSLFNDGLADALIKMETKFLQTDREISLMAKKKYVDEKTGEIHTKYDGLLSVQAEKITAIVSKTDNIKNTIDTAGWITKSDSLELFASKSFESGETIISAINLSPGTIKIAAKNIELSGVVSFSSFDTDLQNKFGTITTQASNAEASAKDAANSASSAQSSASNAESSASSASNDAYWAAKDASNAADSASSAATDASNAATDASNAATSASEAKTAAEKAEEALAGVPSWAKAESIRAAMEGETIIVGGFLNTKVIKVNNIAADKGTVAGMTIGNVGLFIKRSDGMADLMRLDDNKILFNSDDGTLCASIGAVTDFGTVYAGYFKASRFSTKMVVGKPDTSSVNRWIDAQCGATHSYFQVETRYLSDSLALGKSAEITCIWPGLIPRRSVAESLVGSPCEAYRVVLVYNKNGRGLLAYE